MYLFRPLMEYVLLKSPDQDTNNEKEWERDILFRTCCLTWTRILTPTQCFLGSTGIFPRTKPWTCLSEQVTHVQSWGSGLPTFQPFRPKFFYDRYPISDSTWQNFLQTWYHRYHILWGSVTSSSWTGPKIFLVIPIWRYWLKQVRAASWYVRATILLAIIPYSSISITRNLHILISMFFNFAFRFCWDWCRKLNSVFF